MHSADTDERKNCRMTRLNTEAVFECIQQLYRFNITILIDDVACNLRFHFTATEKDTQRLPAPAQRFDVITTFYRHIIFNRLAVSDDPLQEAIKDCVEAYIRSFKHPLLKFGTGPDE
jgi:hypothetical protein